MKSFISFIVIALGTHAFACPTGPGVAEFSVQAAHSNDVVAKVTNTIKAQPGKPGSPLVLGGDTLVQSVNRSYYVISASITRLAFTMTPAGMGQKKIVVATANSDKGTVELENPVMPGDTLEITYRQFGAKQNEVSYLKSEVYRDGCGQHLNQVR